MAKTLRPSDGAGQAKRIVRQLSAERRIDFVRLGRRVIYPLSAVELYEREQLVEARVATMPRRRNA